MRASHTLPLFALIMRRQTCRFVPHYVQLRIGCKLATKHGHVRTQCSTAKFPSKAAGNLRETQVTQRIPFEETTPLTDPCAVAASWKQTSQKGSARFRFRLTVWSASQSQSPLLKYSSYARCYLMLRGCIKLHRTELHRKHPTGLASVKRLQVAGKRVRPQLDIQILS